VLVESGSGKLLERISLGLLHSGLTRVRFTLGHLKPGTYRLLIPGAAAEQEAGARTNP